VLLSRLAALHVACSAARSGAPPPLDHPGDVAADCQSTAMASRNLEAPCGLKRGGSPSAALLLTARVHGKAPLHGLGHPLRLALALLDPVL
jgi:hypothetical protein